MNDRIYTQIQIRRDSRANWNNANPTPALGEICIILNELPTPLKIGDGVHSWKELPEQTLRDTKGFEFSGTVNPYTDLSTIEGYPNLGYLIATEPGVYSNLRLSKKIYNLTIFVPTEDKNWNPIDLGIPFVNPNVVPKFYGVVNGIVGVIPVTDDALALEHKNLYNSVVYYIPFASINGVLKQVFAYKIGNNYYTSSKVLSDYVNSNLDIFDNKLFQNANDSRLYIYTGRNLKIISECYSVPKFKSFIDIEVSVLDTYPSLDSGYVVFSRLLNRFIYCLEDATNNPKFYKHWLTENDYLIEDTPRGDTLFSTNNRLYFWNGYTLAELNSSVFTLKVVQETGSSKEDVMSQWAVTNELKKITIIPDYNVKFVPNRLEIDSPDNVEMSWDINIDEASITEFSNLNITKNSELIHHLDSGTLPIKGNLNTTVDATEYITVFEISFELDGVSYSKVFEYFCENPVFLGFTDVNDDSFDIKENSVKTLLNSGEYKDLFITCPYDGLYMYVAVPCRMGSEQLSVQLTSFESNGIEIPLDEPISYIFNERIQYNIYLTAFKLIAGVVENIDLLIT